jgi:hypothetical protein
MPSDDPGYAAVEIGGIAEMSIMPEVPDTV